MTAGQSTASFTASGLPIGVVVIDHALNRAAGSIALSYKGSTVVNHAFDLAKN